MPRRIMREDSVWGHFWTVSLPARATAVWFALYRSNLFTEPMLGFCEFSIPPEESSQVRKMNRRIHECTHE